MEPAKVDRRSEKWRYFGYTEPPPSQHFRPSRQAWLQRHAAALAAYQKEYRKNNKRTLREKKLARLQHVKELVYEHYGGNCACCGEPDIRFMTIDHINGRDKEAPKATGKKLWQQVYAAGFPGCYQMLCFNCNCAKGVLGICPHQMKEE